MDYSMLLIWCYYLVLIIMAVRSNLNELKWKYTAFFAEWGFRLPIEYFDSIKGRLSDSYSVIGQVWMLFIVTIRPWSLAMMYGFNTPYHSKSHNWTSSWTGTASGLHSMEDWSNYAFSMVLLYLDEKSFVFNNLFHVQKCCQQQKAETGSVFEPTILMLSNLIINKN